MRMLWLLLTILAAPFGRVLGDNSPPSWDTATVLNEGDTVLRGVLVAVERLDFIKVGGFRCRLSRETEVYMRGYREELRELHQLLRASKKHRRPVILTVKVKWRNGERIAQRIEFGRAPPGTPPGGIKGKTIGPRPKK